MPDLSILPDESPPADRVVLGDRVSGDYEDEFDFIVVGSGAAGAVAAHVLASAGLRVLICEEGPWVKTREFGEDVYGAFERTMRDVGTQSIEGRSFIPLLQGRCVGGSTVVNSAIAWRTPGDVLEDWGERFGLGDVLTEAILAPHFDALERDLSVRAVADDVLGESNRRFLEVADRMGVSAQRMRRYDKACQGSGRCLTGCPNGAKQGMNITYVPWALEKGATILTHCRVGRLTHRAGRTTGVEADLLDAMGSPKGRARVSARRGVLVAASTIQSPVLLASSGVKSRALGEHFQAHPGVALAALFDDPIDMTFGASQGAESIAYRVSDRFKLETIAMQPELLAARAPGLGDELMKRLECYPHLAVWAAQVRARAEGRVARAWGGGARVRYSMLEGDMRAVRKACSVIAQLMFEAGAREVWPGIFGLPSVLKSRDEVSLIDDGPLDSRAYGMIASHLFGAARMGRDPKTSVVGLDWQVHGLEGAYVVDSSVFPTNLGVNPQHSIMALARLAATRLAGG